MSFWGWLSGSDRRNAYRFREERRRRLAMTSSIDAANRQGRGTWMGMPDDEDAANTEYATNRAAIMQRAQDLDVNNPDVGGFHRTRVAQLIGSGVHFKHAAEGKEVGIPEPRMVEISQQLDRVLELHSKDGGFDSQGRLHWEGKQQERALLTMFVYGSCLIHRVWRPDAKGLLPLSLEIIPGSRISTPYEEYGNPLVSFGVRYTDDHRTRVVGHYVRRVSRTVGNSFVMDTQWDLLPIEDCALLTLTEAAGIDQALPLCTRVMRMLRNRGEFVEASVESARAQAGYYAVTQCAPDADPYYVASDDREESMPPLKTGVSDIGGGVKMLYSPSGEEIKWNSAKLPDPQFADFMDKTDERTARGLVTSFMRFTRRVGNSFAGGRMEDAQDDPIVAQYRLSLLAAWHKVNAWKLEACYLTGAAEMPGYSPKTQHLWNQFRAEFPEKIDINPYDTARAAMLNLMLRKFAPQAYIERGGADPRTVLRDTAKFMQMTREIEKEFDLDEGALTILFTGKAVTTAAGEEVGAATPVQDPDETKQSPGKKKKNGANGHRLLDLLTGET